MEGEPKARALGRSATATKEPGSPIGRSHRETGFTRISLDARQRRGWEIRHSHARMGSDVRSIGRILSRTWPFVCSTTVQRKPETWLVGDDAEKKSTQEQTHTRTH